MADDFFDVPVNQIQEDAAPLPIPSSIVPTYKSKSPSILEDLAIEAYLKYLEGEVVAYISLTQTESALLKGVAIRMMAVLKDQLNSRMSGIASSSMRQKMLKIILSERFPSPKYCNIYIKRARKQNEIEAHRQHIAIAAAVAAVGIQPAAIALAGNMPPINQELNNPLPGVMDDPLPAAQAAALGIEAAVGAHNANPLLHNAEENIIPEDTEQVYSNCPNTCCTGAFIQEAMAGVIMSADIRELIFTSEQVGSRRSSTFSCLEFNIPVVLTHLLSATHQHFSQLERLIFSENFVKEDSSISSLTEEEASNRLRLLQHQDPVAVLEHQYRKQDRFARHFAAVTTQTASGNHNNVYCSADRKGLALGLLVMFRDVAPRSPLTGDLIGFYKLTEIVLKNNVQCELYSKANFQFELLARIGFCCPRLKVLDLFGTDTWADCLVAFFFRDAFHSLHRYLFFMENEEDEDSAYHPHDLTRYCQFCLDRLHPVAVERPFTINPVIPLIDPIYDHVIKKYPKRSYCILRNCVKVSDLIQCPKSTVYELLRPPLTAQTQSSSTCNVPTLPTCSENSSSSTVANRNEISTFPGDPLALSNHLCRTDTVRSDVIDETHDPSEYLIDDSCSNDDSTSSGTIEADTIRSRLRSATKSTCVIKSNRSRRNLKGTRQNQDRVYITSKENVQFVKSTSQFKDSSSKAFNEKNEENQLQKLHKNWKKRSIRNEGDLENNFECSCSFKENQSKSNGIEEQALSKIINDDGVLTILPRDKTTRDSSISGRRDLGSKSARHNPDRFLNNECFASSDKLILNDEKTAFRRSSRLIAKTLKSSKSSKKTKFLNTKPKVELLREYLCENCANKLPDSKLIFDMPNLYKTGGSKNQLNNSIAQKLKPYKCQKCYAMQNTNAKYTSIYNSHVKLIETRTRSRKESKGMDIKSDNSIMTKNPSIFRLEENLYNEDIVMTRSMRKRKVRWIKRGKNVKKIGSNEPCDGKKYPSIELGSMEGSNILHEKKRARQSSKIENSKLHVPSLEEDGNKSSLNEAPAKYNGYVKEYMYSSSQQISGANNQSCSEIMTITFEEWQKEASNKWAAYSSSECDCSHWQQGMAWSNSNDGKTKTGTNCSQDRYGPSSNMPYHARNMSTNVRKEAKEKTSSNPSNPSIDSLDSDWSEPKNVHYREISSWPHLNDCIQTLELLNIGGTNVLGEFIPFILLYAPRLKSLGQWINTMIYGLEILRQLPGQSKTKFSHIEEFSYSTDRNYFCQPYIGFVPESNEYRNVRKEMVRQSAKVAKRLGHSVRNHAAKRQQIEEDVNLMVDACPNVHKLNLVLHHKLSVLDEADIVRPWSQLTMWSRLKELDLVTMRFSNVRTLLKVVGSKLISLTLEMDDEQGSGSEIVHIARHCPELRSLRLLIGDKILRGEMTLHFGTKFFRHLERLTVEGAVHLHGFAFLWGHCTNLNYLRIGNVVSNEVTTTNVLIYDVFTLLFQVNKMVNLEEMHIKNLKIRSLQMGQFLLENLPRLKKASNWLLDIYGQDLADMKRLIFSLKRSKALSLDFREW